MTSPTPNLIKYQIQEFILYGSEDAMKDSAISHLAAYIVTKVMQKDGVARITDARLAKNFGCSEKTMSRRVAKLMEIPWFTVERGKRTKATEYTITPFLYEHGLALKKRKATTTESKVEHSVSVAADQTTTTPDKVGDLATTQDCPGTTGREWVVSTGQKCQPIKQKKKNIKSLERTIHDVPFAPPGQADELVFVLQPPNPGSHKFKTWAELLRAFDDTYPGTKALIISDEGFWFPKQSAMISSAIYEAYLAAGAKILADELAEEHAHDF